MVGDYFKGTDSVLSPCPTVVLINSVTSNILHMHGSECIGPIGIGGYQSMPWVKLKIEKNYTYKGSILFSYSGLVQGSEIII